MLMFGVLSAAQRMLGARPVAVPVFICLYIVFNVFRSTKNRCPGATLFVASRQRMRCRQATSALLAGNVQSWGWQLPVGNAFDSNGQLAFARNKDSSCQ